MQPPQQFGRYLVHEQLGAGGMATVHRAVEQGGRPVALKRLRHAIAGDDRFVRDLVREAHLASQLVHPNIAQIYDLGRDGDTYYIAMELVAGHDLRRVLAHAAASVGPLPVPVVLDLLGQICDALDCAHRLGVVHRDISPANLIVGRDGLVKVIDFGIAKAQGAASHTAAGVVKGKFSYMAPEYLSRGELDARSDLFAVGVVGHELLTAHPLFTGGDDVETLERVRNLAVPPPSRMNPAVPAAVDQILLAALERDPARRWQSARAIRNALDAVGAPPRGTAFAWIDWMMQQPARPALATLAESHSVSIEIQADPRTVIGVAPPRPGGAGGPVLMSREMPAAMAPRATMAGWSGPARLGVGTAPPRSETIVAEELVVEEAPAPRRGGPSWIVWVVILCGAVAGATFAALHLLTQ